MKAKPARTIEGAAMHAVSQVVRSFLKLPSQAKISGEYLIERSGRFFFFTADVDAPTRHRWCVILGFRDDAGEDLIWSHRLGAWECDDNPRALAIAIHKAASEWPGSDIQLMNMIVGQDGAKHLLSWLDGLARTTGISSTELRRWTVALLVSGASEKDLDKFVGAALDVKARSGGKGGGSAIGALCSFIEARRLSSDDLVDLGLTADDLRRIPRLRRMTDQEVRAEAAKGHLSNNDLFMTIAGGPGKQLGHAWVASRAPAP